MGQAGLRAACPAMPQREHARSSLILTSTGIPATLHLHMEQDGLSLKVFSMQVRSGGGPTRLQAVLGP